MIYWCIPILCIYRNKKTDMKIYHWMLCVGIIVGMAACQKTGISDTVKISPASPDTTRDVKRLLDSSSFTLFRMAAEKIGLLTIDTQGNRTKDGTFVTEVGPLSKISPAAKYEFQVADADFSPVANAAISKAVHTHSGPEIWYVLTGAQCLETPAGAQRASAGRRTCVLHRRWSIFWSGRESV